MLFLAELNSQPMKLFVRFSLILLAFFTFQGTAIAQSDTTVTYDVVYLTKGGMLKGEILSFNEETGLMVFKDTKGVKYSLNQTEYKSFVENKVFVEKRGPKVIKERKEDEFEVSGGFRVSFLSMNDQFTPDDYYLSSGGGVSDLPMSIYVGVGKYFTRRHFAGVSGELALSSYGSKYFSAGLRYSYQYDAQKRNVALYIPVELQYFNSRYDQWYEVNDTVVEQQGGGTVTYFPAREDLVYDLRAVSLSFGQGLSFIMENKHSISLELSFVKFFMFEPKYIGLEKAAPKSSLNGNGLRFSLIYNI